MKDKRFFIIICCHTGQAVYRFVGVEENVLHELLGVMIPNNPASMSVFEHRGILFFLATETFTDDGDFGRPSYNNGSLYLTIIRVRIWVLLVFKW